MIPVVSFVGNSGSGKTTLLEGVVRELKRLGYRVAVVKHAPCGFDIDQPGKDSWRLTQAGSDVVVISSSERMAFIERVGVELTLTQIKDLIGDRVDIVLTEGYKQANTVKIEVAHFTDDVVGIVDLLITQMRQNRLVISGKPS